MLKRIKTDADLPPIKRVWSNYWEKEYRKMAEEVRKANKGIRRAQKWFHKAALEREQLRKELARERERVQETRLILAGGDFGSLPNDWTLPRIADARMDDMRQWGNTAN